jgi:hypothetical protein
LKKEDENPAPPEEENVNDAATTAGSSTAPADIVNLVPFDVQIAVTLNNGIQFSDVNKIVVEWLNRIYPSQLATYGYDDKQYSTFTGVILFNNGDDNKQRTRNLLRQRTRRMSSSGALYTAKFRGAAVFSKDSSNVQSVPENDVLVIQQVALLNDTSLLTMLQSSTAIGLGSAVVDVQAFLNPVGSSTADGDSNSTTAASPDKQLEIVIIVAIVVACVAFLFLLAAVFWAYMYDRSNQANRRRRRDGSNDTPSPRKKSSRKQPKTPATTSTSKKSSSGRDRTDSSDTGDEHTPEEKNQERRPSKNDLIAPYPTMIDNSGAAEVQSVISDSLVSNSNMSGDISTSLSAYYRSGMGKVSSSEIYSARLQHQSQRGMLDDAGSVSSMESYGYSLGGDEGTTTTPHVVVVEQQNHYAMHDTRERIGGLPVEPDLGNVQIPDLDKELAELDVQLLSPNIQEILMNTNLDDDDDLDPDVDLANYQMEDDEDEDEDDDDEEIETVMDDPPASFLRQTPHNVVDVDDIKADDEVNEYPQETI